MSTIHQFNPFYPIRITTTNKKLIVYLSSNPEDLDPSCLGSGERFRVYLHGSNEVPWSSHQTYDIAIKTHTTLLVKPRIVMATDQMKTYRPERRKCYFEGEKRLKYFEHYTKRNCEFECLINITQALCSCSRFDFPREPNERICGLSDYKCVSYMAQEMFLKEISLEEEALAKYYMEKWKPPYNTIQFGCNCWTSCRSIQYEADKRETKFFDFPLAMIKTDQNGTIDYDMTKLVITFKDSEFFAMKRSELYGLTDFIANCGGLLGLFMGISLLSFAEIFYFFTVRYCVGMFTRRKVIETEDIEKDEEPCEVQSVPDLPVSQISQSVSLN